MLCTELNVYGRQHIQHPFLTLCVALKRAVMCEKAMPVT